MKDQTALQPSRSAAPAPAPRAARAREAVIQALVKENAALRKKVAKLESFRTLAYRDAMTGLWNRRYFEERLAEELSRSERSPGRRFSVMVVDVNGLKMVNDSLGHAAGDRLITLAGRFLLQALRSYDLCCRIGGDEFAVIFPELGAEGCDALVARLRRQLDRLNVSRGQALGLSFGCATCPAEAATLTTLLADADTAMYADKRRQKRAAEAALQSSI